MSNILVNPARERRRWLLKTGKLPLSLKPRPAGTAVPDFEKGWDWIFKQSHDWLPVLRERARAYRRAGLKGNQPGIAAVNDLAETL